MFKICANWIKAHYVIFFSINILPKILPKNLCFHVFFEVFELRECSILYILTNKPELAVTLAAHSVYS